MTTASMQSHESDFSHFVSQTHGGEHRIELVVDSTARGVDFAAVEAAVAAVPGVAAARFNVSSRRLIARLTGNALPAAGIFAALDQLGLRAYPFERDAEEASADAQARWLLRCLAVAGFAAMNIMLLSVSVWSGNVTDITPETRDLFHGLSALIALPACAYAGQPFFRSAIAALRTRNMNMDVPISLGVLLALGMSVVETLNHASHAYFDSAVMLLLFLLAGRYLDHAMRRRTRAFAGNLAALKAHVVRRIDDEDDAVFVPVAALRPGDRVQVLAGERIPVDGVILTGRSEIDDSLITGETLPRPVAPGEPVHAGAMNGGGVLTLRTTAAGENTLLSDIDRLLQAAGEARGLYRRLADRVARAYAPVVHIAAAATAIGWLAVGASLHDAIITAIAVLIITCPCALALAVPAVQVVASGHLFRRGVLLNSADALERLAEIDTIVFDKTGTLTVPEPQVANTAEIPVDLLEAAGQAAAFSRHPLAQALVKLNGDPSVVVADVEEVPGQGIALRVNGVPVRLGRPDFCQAQDQVATVAARFPDASLVAIRAGERCGVIVLRQSLRPQAARVIRDLREAGYRLLILSGDRAEAVTPVAEALGIETHHGGLTPAQKISWIERLGQDGSKVLMVGDGLNDAPALAAAHASIAPASATSLAQAKADAVFLADGLGSVADILAMARRAMGLMRQNLGIALVYNLIAVPLAVAGFVTPLIAAAAMSGSSIIVIANAARARTVSPPGTDRSDAAPEAPAAAALA